mmetsp:Transcript_39607/g.114599  ORF Transcript_39607/g.114599 Transcript_39607/m.114599 type:complete len:210 (-) Transcript_39607:813-1442(-)
MNVETLCLPLQTQASFAKLVDVDPLRLVGVQQAEQHASVIGVDVQRLDVLSQTSVLQEVLHLIARDVAGTVLVDLLEHLPDMRHRDLALVLTLLDQQVLVMLSTHHSALHENAREHIHNAEEDDGDIQDEKVGVKRAERFQHGLEGVAPRHATCDGHEQRHEAPCHAAVQALDLCIRIRLGAALEIGDGLTKEDAEEVDDEEQNQQRPE